MITTFNTRTANSFSGVAVFALRRAAVGGVTTLTVAGTLTGAGALARQLTTVEAGLLTWTGTLRAMPAKAVAGTAGLAGAFQPQAARGLTGLLASIGTIQVSPQVRQFAGLLGMTSTLELIRSPLLTVTSTLPLAGALIWRLSFTRTGVVASTGAVQQTVRRLFAAALGSVGTLGTDLARGFTGTLPSTSTMTLAQGQAVAVSGTVPSTGSMQTRPVLDLLGHLGPVSTVHGALIRSVQGVLGAVGAVQRRTMIAQTGALALHGALAVTRATTQSLAGLLVPVGAAYQQAQLVIARSVGLAGAAVVVSVEVLVVSGFLPLSGFLAAPILARGVSGTLGLIGTVIVAPAVLIRYGTITLVNAILRFAGLREPKLTGRGTVRDPALSDHATLDDPELR